MKLQFIVEYNTLLLLLLLLPRPCRAPCECHPQHRQRRPFCDKCCRKVADSSQRVFHSDQQESWRVDVPRNAGDRDQTSCG